ncbi:hypothetical protein [Paenibacillus glycinis]|uniref:NEAT domain-containing protein n=1 Tax=Paenibacillus glycinis TaxID=2697035 RepID=A0ABW9Y033_9BACL|nr:hypothetical protein [Paenibacillus glycinis]NBD28348.1 hypothetical protein [Paenibacillus glycinis]
MMKTKFFLTALTVVAVLTPFALHGVLAANQSNKKSVPLSLSVSQNFQSKSNNDGGNNTLNILSGTASGSKITSSAFVVPVGYGHVKLNFLNKGTSDTMVTVQHSDSAMVYFTTTISANKSFTWRSTVDFPQGMRSGHYIVSIRSSSANVNVAFSGFASDKEVEVQGKANF